MKITKKIAENFLSNRYDDGLRDFTLIEDAALLHGVAGDQPANRQGLVVGSASNSEIDAFMFVK